MARRKKHAEHANHERWLVSYADFITLLFAFFVVMFAVSQVDTKKMGRFSESFKGAIDFNMFDNGKSGLMPEEIPQGSMSGENGRAEVKEKSIRAREDIRKDLMAAGGKLGGVKVIDDHGDLILRLPETLLFSIGQADIQETGSEVLKVIAEELMNRPVRIRIEGHTDSTPIHTDRFPSNWELSTARATAVIEYWLADLHFDPKRLAASGYGEWHPIASNDTAEGRAQNRRVDIIILATSSEELDQIAAGTDAGENELLITAPDASVTPDASVDASRVEDARADARVEDARADAHTVEREK